MWLPQSYKDITVKQYAELKKITLKGEELRIKQLSILTGKDEEYFNNLDFGHLTSIFKFTNFLNSDPIGHVKRVLWINGTRYVAKSEMKEFNKECVRYLSTKTYLDDFYGNMHHILSWIYYPTFAKHDPEKAAEDFLTARISDVAGTFFLFSRKLQRSKASLQCSRSLAIETINQRMTQIVTSSQNLTAGITH